MRKPRILLAFTLLAACGAAAAQTAPAQPAAPQPPQAQENPRLNLRLDDKDLRSAIPYTPPKEAGKKQEASDGLPGLGGRPSTSWDQPAPEQVVPKSNDKL